MNTPCSPRAEPRHAPRSPPARALAERGFPPTAALSLLSPPPPLSPAPPHTPSQSELGDVVYVELPEVGSQVTKGESFGVVESVKSASDVYSPVDGEVVEVNGALADDPAKLNADAFGGGWMMKVKVGGAGATDGLLDAAAYKKSVGA